MRRARRWRARRDAGELEDLPGGGHPVHGLRPGELDAILALHRAWGEVDRSHRKLAHRGSYEQLVWVSLATVRRVLAAHDLFFAARPALVASVRQAWPEWVDYEPNTVWGYDLTTFSAAWTQALALLDLVSRKWLDVPLCAEATSIQVQVLFTRALEAE